MSNDVLSMQQKYLYLKM